MDAVRIENLCYRFPDSTQALQDVSFHIPVGAKVAILGPNGAGKSTLVQHLNGLILPQQGKIRIFGQEISSTSVKDIRRKVGVVFQNPDDQVFSPTVWEDVAFGPYNLGLSEADITERCDVALAAVGMREYKEKAPYHLSYGQKKRVAIAGVLAMQPELIVLDEPMAYLDPRGKDEIISLLQKLHFLGKTVIVTTHDVDFAAEWADWIVLMKDGRLLTEGGTELLIDARWVKKAHLHYPKVSRPFLMVPQLKLERVPKNEQEAARLLWLLHTRGRETATLT